MEQGLRSGWVRKNLVYKGGGDSFTPLAAVALGGRLLKTVYEYLQNRGEAQCLLYGYN